MRSSRSRSWGRGSRAPRRSAPTTRHRCWRAGNGRPVTEGPRVNAHRPIVAISEGFADYGDYYGFGYGRPLLAAGPLPVLLPYLEAEPDRAELIDRVDGLVLAGGRDIEP